MCLHDRRDMGLLEGRLVAEEQQNIDAPMDRTVINGGADSEEWSSQAFSASG